MDTYRKRSNSYKKKNDGEDAMKKTMNIEVTEPT